jgi:hypothetical protein
MLGRNTSLMRIRIVQRPGISSIDGIRLDRFELGREYDVGNNLAALFLAERWGEPVSFVTDADDTPEFERHLQPRPPRRRHSFEDPANLIREKQSPYLEIIPKAFAADTRRRLRSRR